MTSLSQKRLYTGRLAFLLFLCALSCCRTGARADNEPDTKTPLSNTLRGASSDPRTVTSKQIVDPLKLLGDDMKTKYLKYKSLREDIVMDMVVSYCLDSMDKLYDYAELLGVRYLYLYSKCGFHIPPANRKFTLREVRHQKLPNVGREGHTFLEHMLRTDIDFAEWNLFLQGELEAPVEAIVLALIDMAEHHNRGEQYDFVDITQYHLERTPARCYFKLFSPCTPFDWKKRQLCDLHNEFRYNEKYSCDEAPVSFRGEFLATDDLIRQQNRTTLSRMVDLLSGENNPMIGQFLERDWISILGATHLDAIGPRYRQRTKRIKKRT